MPKFKGLTTGIGSFPHKDATEALDLIFKYCPQIPFWPQLPKRDIREGMVAQYSEGLPCLKVSRDGLFFDAQNKEKELEIFYDRVIKQDIEYFKISKDFSSGLGAFYKRLQESELRNVEYIKCQITGPFTFAASIKDDKGIALLHDSVFMQAIIKGLSRKALWQIKLFEVFRKKIIMFIDEPYLGCFGSAYTPINREDVIKGLTELIQEASSSEVLWGLHCCGNTDWSIFTDIRTIDIISFDAFSFLDKLILYADELKKFFAQDRSLCWGVVPTQEFNGKVPLETLVKKIDDGIEALVKKGVERSKLSENLMLSPSCGLGTLDIKKAGQIFKLLSQLSSYIRNLNNPLK